MGGAVVLRWGLDSTRLDCLGRGSSPAGGGQWQCNSQYDSAGEVRGAAMRISRSTLEGWQRVRDGSDQESYRSPDGTLPHPPRNRGQLGRGLGKSLSAGASIDWNTQQADHASKGEQRARLECWNAAGRLAAIIGDVDLANLRFRGLVALLFCDVCFASPSKLRPEGRWRCAEFPHQDLGHWGETSAPLSSH